MHIQFTRSAVIPYNDVRQVNPRVWGSIGSSLHSTRGFVMFRGSSVTLSLVVTLVRDQPFAVRLFGRNAYYGHVSHHFPSKLGEDALEAAQ